MTFTQDWQPVTRPSDEAEDSQDTEKPDPLPVSNEPILSQVLAFPDSPVHATVDPAPKSPCAEFQKCLEEELSKHQASEPIAGTPAPEICEPPILAEGNHTASVASTGVGSNPSSGRSTPKPARMEATLRMLQAYEDHSYIKS